MMKLIATAVFLSAVLPVQAGSLADDLWFFADFDRPTQMAGSSFGQELPAGGFCEGRFGKGYRFHRPAVNLLPPMKEFLTDRWIVRHRNGFKVKPVTVKMRKSNGAQYTSVTCSFYVKGEKDAKLKIVAPMAPLTTNQLSAVEKSGLKRDKLYPEHSVTNVVKLTGAWQRVSVAVRNDYRLDQSRIVSLAAVSSAPIEYERFQYEQSATYPYFFNEHPTLWTEGGTSRIVRGYESSDRARIDSFPTAGGAFACWARSDPDNAAPNDCVQLWSYTKPWAENWRGGTGGIQSGRGSGLAAKGGGRSGEWRHFAATWGEGRLTVYVDGKKVGERMKDVVLDPMRPDTLRTLRIGSFGDAKVLCDCVLDEFAIFSRELSAEEILSLATAKRGLLDRDDAFLMGAVEVPHFWRNETDAALRFTLSAGKAGTYAVEAHLDGLELGRTTVALNRSATEVRLPFNPSVRRPGAYGVRVNVINALGQRVFTREVSVTIHGTLVRNRFLMMSWGGPDCTAFLRDTVGLNGVNIRVGSSMLQQARAAAEHDFNVCFRYENSNALETFANDLVTIERKAEKALKPFAGAHLWTSTLVNSEVWGFDKPMRVWKEAWWVKRATKALGHPPSYAIKASAPTEIDYKAAGHKPLRGVIPDGEPTLSTILWMDGEGSPLYDDHLTLGKTVKRLSPGNVVWSEPHAAGGFLDCVDMGAGWYYEYDTAAMLSRLVAGGGKVRAQGKLFQPTLGMDYWPELPAKVNGAQVDLGQTADELIVKSWIALAAVKTHSLSYFSADRTWWKGERETLAYLTNRTQKVHSICNPGDPARYGRFVRERFLPAAELLRDMPNVRAPFAVLVLSEPRYLGGFWFGHYHHTTHVPELLARQPGAFEVLYDGDCAAEELAKHSYVYVPMLNCVTKSHDRELRAAAAKGTRLVLDTYCTNTYANAERLAISYRYPFRRPDCEDPLYDFYTNRLDELTAALPAWSETDGKSSYTFAKESGGVTYVTVVNNARRTGGCIQTEIVTNGWYRPCTAPQRITTHFNVPKGSAVYEFNGEEGRGNWEQGLGDGKRGGVTLTRDFKASEGKVFCVHPEPLAKPELTFTGEAIKVVIRTKSGKPAPGRTVVRLALTDPDGRVCDESGLYRVEGGKAEIPVRFASEDKTGSLLSPWKAEVSDLTSGERESVSFQRK